MLWPMTDFGDPVAIEFAGDRLPFREGVTRAGSLELHVATTPVGSGTAIVVTIANPSTAPVPVDRLAVVLTGAPSAVLEAGYQSWSVVRRATPDDVRPERRGLPDWARGMHSADPDAAGTVVAGDHALVTTGGVVGFLDGRSNLGTVVARPGELAAIALLDGVHVAPGATRSVDPVWVSAGPPGARYSEYADLWGQTADARIDAAVPVGWCSWYQYFGAVTPADVRANLRLAALHRLEAVQIDDGYQAAIGDWLATSPAWTEGTGALAEEISAAGLTPGIWTAPFLAGENSTVARDHPDWFSMHSSGHPSKAQYNAGHWGGWALALDTTRPDVLDHITATFAALRAQGFTYHKIDFCYAAALPGRRRDPARTRAEAVRQGLEAVRAGIGDDAFLLGCGCPFGPAVGIVDAMRVSPDVAPFWAPDRSWDGYAESAPSARNAIAASVLRAPLHRRLFVNDPDCLLLRPDDTRLDAGQRAMLASVITGTGGFTLVSDNLSLYTSAEWELLGRIRAVLPAVDTWLDIDDPFANPVVVRSRAGTKLEVDWRDGVEGAPRAELGTVS
jgi:alpha-galactosidase